MKIDFSQLDKNSFTEIGKQEAAGISKDSGREKKVNSGFKLDISGIVKDNAAFGSYDGQGKAIEECMQEFMGTGISGMDMQTQRNYYAVMSNSMSAEDFGKIKEDGFIFNDMEPEEMVTTLDKIKIELAESGVTIDGYNDNLSNEDIINATGGMTDIALINQALRENDYPITEDNVDQVKEAIDVADQLAQIYLDGKIPDINIRYLLENNQAPTLNNLLLAQYKSTNQPVMKISDEQVVQLNPQFEKIIDDAGYDVSDELMNDAKWFIENQLPLTEDSFSYFEELKNIKIPFEKSVIINKALEGLGKGIRPTDVSLIKNERLLSEARLKMTMEANYKLVGSDYYISTDDLEDKIEGLKYLEKLFNNEEGNRTEINSDELINNPIQLYRETVSRVDFIKEMPIETVSEISDNQSLNDVYEKGLVNQLRYQQAGIAYETYGTKVRVDLDDNIQKAFDHIDDILEDYNLEDSESNRRAIRILGYNQMEINADNIFSVKEADEKLTHLLNNLTPANVINLIRNGVNPLTQSIESLTEILESYDTENRQDIKYSEYLWKLEKNNEITKEEKETYIGIYRLFRQIEKTDGAVIGGLLNQKADLTVKNLLSQLRTQKKKGMDITIDNKFGVSDDLIKREKSISDQINTVYQTQEYLEKKIKDALLNISGEKLKSMDDRGLLNSETTIEQLADQMNESLSGEEEQKAQELDREYNEYQSENIRQIMKTEEEVIKNLESCDMPETLDNIYAMYLLVNERGGLFKNLSKFGKDLNTKEFIEKFNDKDSAQEAMDLLLEECDETLEKAKEEVVDSTSLEILRIANKQINIISELSRQESYEIPVEIDGEITSVNLKIIHGEDKGNLEVNVYTEDKGELSIQLGITKHGVDGIMLAQTNNGIDFLNSRKDIIFDTIEETGENVSRNIPIIINRGLTKLKDFSTGNVDNDEHINTRRLYNVAKAFIKAIQ